MPQDIIDDKDTGANLPPNERSFGNGLVNNIVKTGEVVADAADSFTSLFTPEPSVDVPIEEPSGYDPLSAELPSTTEISTPGLGFASNIAHEVENGLGSNLYNMVEDYANAQPSTDELDAAMLDTATAMVEKFKLDSTVIDEIMSESESVEEVERRATRLVEQKAYMESLDNTGFGQQIAAGFAGFVLDPVNLIPGGAVIGAGRAATKVVPKLSSVLTNTTLGKTATFAAMGATEEALRNYPRLMNDPAYSYEMYRMDVAIGAGFGGGLAAAMPVAKFGMSKVAQGVSKAVDKYSTSLNSRMATNTLTDVLRVTKAPKARKEIQDAIDAATGPEAKAVAEKAAKVERAQNQVNNSKLNLKVRDMQKSTKEKLDEGIFDADEVVKEFADELKATSPTFAKIAEAIAKKIKRAAEKLEGKDQSVGAAKRKTTPRDVVEDFAADHEVARKALDDIDRAFDAASGAAKAAKDFKAESALNAMRSAAKRAVIEKAKIQGVKLKKVKMTAADVEAAVGSKYKRYQKVINLADNDLNKVLKDAGSDRRDVLTTTYHAALKAAGTSMSRLSKDLRDNPAMGKRIELTLDKHFEDLIDDLYTGTGVKYTVADDLGGALASTNRKTGEIKLRSNLTKDEILNHIKGAIDNPVSKQKQVVLGAAPGLTEQLEKMSLAELKSFILKHEFAHTKQDLNQYQSDTKQSIAESLGLADAGNKFLSDSAIKLEVEANAEAIKGIDADAALYEALFGAYNKVRADMQWAITASKERSAEQVSLDPEWAMMSKDFTEGMGDDLKLLGEIYNSGLNKTLRNQFGGFTRSYAGELAASQTPLAQWAALHIFELPGGTGGKIARNETAAISMEMFEAAAVHPVNVAWDAATRAEAKHMKLDMFASAVMRHSSAAADRNSNALGRKVQLEMNARQMGLKSDAPAHVKAYADELEKAYDGLYQVQFDNGVQGITGNNKIKSYMRQSWSEKRIMDALDPTNEAGIGGEGLETLIMASLKSRNPEATQKSLRDRAKTITGRMKDNVTKHEEGTNNIVTDGDYINERVLHLDLSTEIDWRGTKYSVLDFMSNDVTSDLNKYAKKTSATAAISKASGGKLNSSEAINSFIHAVGQESQALGTHVDVGDLTNSFKLMMGEPIKGFDPRARKIRDAVALSGMNGLGESQLAELGLAMNRGAAAVFAAKQVFDRAAGKLSSSTKEGWQPLKYTSGTADNVQVLSDMQNISTLYDQMHNLARQNVHFDDAYHGESTSATMGALNKVVDVATGGKYRPVLQHAQTKYTGYGSIRTMQEQVAMAGLMHDVGRKIMGYKHNTSDARLADIGIPMDLLRQKVKDGTMELDYNTGNIKAMNLENWTKQERHTLGVALRRHSAQQVQVGFAGEQSALMNNPWVAFMMQFKTYPNIAAEKQQMRNAMFMDKEAAMGQVLNAASSMAARMIRYESLALALPENKREEYLDYMYENRLLKDTALYMGGVGSMMNTYDMATDPGRNIPPPVFSWGKNYIDAMAGLGNGFSQRDVANFTKALPLGTIAQTNLITGVVRDKMQGAQAVGQLTDAVKGGQSEMDILTNNVSTTYSEKQNGFIRGN